ncbi:YciI family protein [Pelagibacterium xiamenense]|uniref:YciI family protein n=1 Tax=Pelagibacterium xiamenense TaxID=2901140 RepID=UPI001E53F8C0|nr:YciI family protein [Pelagibacterium xiamenense]MCD7060012.1 YciI family protein [Pelagibacterium xiamenense]
MKFMCLVLLDSDVIATMSDADWKELDRACLGYDAELAEKGVFVMAQALKGPEEARTVRVRGGDALVTDGPFMETKEQVAGFILVEARDIDHAVELAKGDPMAKIGAVEVRPTMVVEMPA